MSERQRNRMTGFGISHSSCFSHTAMKWHHTFQIQSCLCLCVWIFCLSSFSFPSYTNEAHHLFSYDKLIASDANSEIETKYTICDRVLQRISIYCDLIWLKFCVGTFFFMWHLTRLHSKSAMNKATAHVWWFFLSKCILCAKCEIWAQNLSLLENHVLRYTNESLTFINKTKQWKQHTYSRSFRSHWFFQWFYLFY